MSRIGSTPFKPARRSLIALTVAVMACALPATSPDAVAAAANARLAVGSTPVNTFIGTQDEGNTFPGA